MRSILSSVDGELSVFANCSGNLQGKFLCRAFELDTSTFF